MDNTKSKMTKEVTIHDIIKTYETISPYVHTTPVFTNLTLDHLVGRKVFFKAENLQKTGAFKARGALNAVLSLKSRDPCVEGVVTHSSGNHGEALAWASKIAQVECIVVVTEDTPKTKCQAIKGYGAELVFCRSSPSARTETCDQISNEKKFPYIPSSDHYDIIAGQGTIAVEFLKQVPELDAILVPVSGGGMASGIAIAAKAIKPNIKVFLVEPEGKMCEQCLRTGKRLWPNPPQFLNTIADGLKLQQLGKLTWPIILDLAEKEVFSVTDKEIIKAMKFVFERMKLVIEPAAGTGVAAVMSERLAAMDPDMKNIGVILCGGNVDIDNLPWY
ncbi:probable serine racemase [Saccostrea echinata]|uniref:probable serine racemase n=1 Tax=Saccostrea echinata TaxID=191078 RepID=UPI002A82BAF1|nr:probable serine racemase [Saccostrea echinata]